MSVRARLTLALIGITTILVVPALFGMERLSELRDIALEMRGRHAVASVAVGRLQMEIGELDRYQRSYIAAGGPNARDSMLGALAAADTQRGLLDRLGYGNELRRTTELLKVLEFATYRVEQLVESGRAAEATDFFDEIKPVVVRTRESLDPVAEAIDRRSESAAVRAGEISSAATMTVLVGLVGSVAVAFLLGLWIIGALTRPIHRLREAMSSVAGGDAEAPPDLPYERSDELGELSRSFRSMTEQIAELNRLKAEFISVASHELKTPINVVHGYAELIAEGHFGDLSEEQREALRTMREQIEVLTDLVDQLLDLSRFESGALPIEMSRVNVEDLLTGVRHAFAALARQQEIELEFDVERSAPELITGDVDRLRNEVLGNLLGNAFKFTDSGGRISVRARGRENGLVVEVSDTGTGIAPEELPHIFEKYYRPGQQERAMGTGLGLAIAREIVEAHHGRISVESQTGRGTTFRFTLPIRPPDEEGDRSVGVGPSEALSGEDGRGPVGAEVPDDPRSGGEPPAVDPSAVADLGL